MMIESILNHKKALIIIAALAGILGCLIDLWATYFLGNRIDGYSQFRGTMSQMGISSSPVAKEVAICWIAMGILIIIFGLGIRIAYEDRKETMIIISWLLILYGFGEGLVSGIFPADKAGQAHTWTGIVHNMIGGVGVTAIMLFPLYMLKVLPDFKWISIIVFSIGITGIILFGIGRLVAATDNVLSVYKGSWQRLYVINYYIYIIIIALNMLFRASYKNS
jgi:hypothetical protein